MSKPISKISLLLAFLFSFSLTSCVRVAPSIMDSSEGLNYFSKEKSGDNQSNEKNSFTFFKFFSSEDSSPESLEEALLVRPGARYSELNSTVSIEVPKEPEVLRMVHHYTKRDRSFVEIGIKRFAQYENLIVDELLSRGLPLDLVNLAFVESCFRKRAKSHAGAAGIWQFMPATARAYGLKVSRVRDDRYNPDKATRAAVAHLVDLYEEFSDWKLAMAAYNAGSGKIRRSIKRVGSRDFFDLARAGVLHRETKNYVPKILALMHITKNLDAYGFSGEMFASLNGQQSENSIIEVAQNQPENSKISATVVSNIEDANTSYGSEFSEPPIITKSISETTTILD